MEFTFFNGPITNKAPAGTMYLSEYIERVRGGEWRTRIMSVRTARNEQEKRQAKSRLPFIMPHGVFTGRTDADLHERSGFRFLEVDNADDPAALRDRIAETDVVAAAWLSASGNGVHILVQLDQGQGGMHLGYSTDGFEYMAKWLGIADTVDPSVKNLNRVVYVSYDPDARMNLFAKALIIPAKANYQTPWADDERKSGSLRAPTFGPQPDLSRVPVPQDYDDWLGALGNIKAAGYSMEDAIAWSSRGGKYKEREIYPGRWDTLKCEETQAEAIASLRRRETQAPQQGYRQ